VDFSSQDIRDIDTLLKLSDQLKDKLSFTVSPVTHPLWLLGYPIQLFMMNIGVTAFLVGYSPQYFYIWYTYVSCHTVD